MWFVLEVVRHTKCAKVSTEVQPGVVIALKARLADTDASTHTHTQDAV